MRFEILIFSDFPGNDHRFPQYGAPYTMGLAVNYPPLLIVDFFVDSCLQYFLSDFERNRRLLI